MRGVNRKRLVAAKKFKGGFHPNRHHFFSAYKQKAALHQIRA
jgi:hypothetical protein